MESVKHWKAKLVLEKILMEDGYSIMGNEYEIGALMTDLGIREYIADVYAVKDGKEYVFEVDGKKGHTSKRDLYKMKLRDSTLLQKGLKTVRIKNEDLVGRKKQPVGIILKEIRYQLDSSTAYSNS